MAGATEFGIEVIVLDIHPVRQKMLSKIKMKAQVTFYIFQP